MATVSPLPIAGRDVFHGSSAPPSGFEEQALGLRRLLGALIRRKFMIGGIMALAFLLAVLYVNQLTPLYSAQVTVLIEGARQNVVNIESVSKGLTPDYYTNETQAAVIESRDIAGKVVDRLDLYRDPDFNPEFAPPEAGIADLVAATFNAWFGDARESAGASDRWAGYTAEEKRAEQREMLIDVFLSGLSVIPSQRALLVEIEYVSSSPELAAKAANAIAEVYIEDQLQTKGSATQKASRWLAQRAAELREKVIDSERRLEEFRRKSGIAEVRGVNLLREQVAKVNADLIAARTRLGEAAARYRQVQGMLRKGNGIETAAAVLDSPLIQRLREQETTVVRKIAELRTQLREQHPRMVLARNELKDLRANITREVNKIARKLGNELQIARVREGNFQDELRRLENQIEHQNDAGVTLRALETEVQANKQLYETIISRFKETDVVDKELQEADAKIISRATMPDLPFYPRKVMMIAVVVFFAGAFGVALAVFLELLDSGFRTVEQLEEVSGIPVIGVVPLLGRQDRSRSPHEVVTRRPNSMIGEAVRSIRTSLMLSGVERAPKTVVFTSSVPAEGKTSLSLSFGGLAARSGQRAIVIDCDLRRASLHQSLGIPNDTGLSNYLGGHAELDDVVEWDPATGLYYITAGPRVAHPTDLLGSQRMNALLQKLAESFDIVVLDTPPLLAVSDALVLLRAVDRVVFIVRWEKTRRESVLAAVKQVADTGAHIGGLVLSQVDHRKQSRYGYSAETGYYYGEAPKYYTE